MFRPNDNLGPYVLLRLLGRGASGEVWLAERCSSLLTTQVALKLALDPSGDLDAVRQEARIWQRASGHPNVVPVLDAEVYDGHIAIASEYVAGGSLLDWLTQNDGKTMAMENVLTILCDILAGLDYLHTHEIIHRDLKPSNVLLQAGRPRLTDFGLSRTLKTDPRYSGIAGTPAYMAPEAFQGHYSVASDIWAAGVILYEMLKGSLPFQQMDFYSVLLAVTRDDPLPLPAAITEPVCQVVKCALAKSAQDRYASAALMWRALDEAVRAKPGDSVAAASRPSGSVRPAIPNNLPLPVTSFVGRTHVKSELRGLMNRSRFLMLTGAGGAGKTRLALQVAEEMMQSYPAGVWLVELASLADPALVVQKVRSVLDIADEPGKSPLQSLIDALNTRRLLLILDNCEHLLDACAEIVSALLHACPQIHILATSREPLGMEGEVLYRVPSLSLPEENASLLPENLLQYEAVRLFVERARAVLPEFQISVENGSPVGSVCRRLDGIPLAIELAAVRVRSLSVQQIDARLNKIFRLLTGGGRAVLPRQKTLRALIDWSYDLLDPEERILAARLSVFAGGWRLEAAESVCADEAIEDWHVLDLLAGLVDKSLVVAERRGPEVRYRLLEIMRQYFSEKLEESGRGAEVRARHADYHLGFVEGIYHKLYGADQAFWFDAIEVEHDNLRAALQWCEDTSAEETELRIVGALGRFWDTRGYLREGQERLSKALARSAEPTLYRAKALMKAGWIAYLLNNIETAGVHFENALTIYRAQNDLHGEAWLLHLLGMLARARKDLVTARALFEQVVEINGRTGDANASAFSNLGAIAHEQGDIAEARRLLERSLEIYREDGNIQHIAATLRGLGRYAQEEGAHDAGSRYLMESLALYRSIGAKVDIVPTLADFAKLACSENKFERAGLLWKAVEDLYNQLNLPWSSEDKQEISRVRKEIEVRSLANPWVDGRSMTLEEAVGFALSAHEIMGASPQES